MLWLLIGILAYFFLALSSLGDKIFLKGKQDPKTYVFYVGLLSGLVVFIIPFINCDPISIWPLLEGVVYIAALYTMYFALDRFEVSIVVPTLGGLQVVFIFLLSIIFFQIKEVSLRNIIALFALIIGTFLISFDKSKTKIKSKELLFCTLSAFLFALDFILTKQVFNTHSFFEGLVYMRLTSFFIVFLFLLNKDFRRNIFKIKKKNNKKLIFIFAQTAGAIGILLQSYAISLASVFNLAILNALKGVQYVFLLILTFLISTLYSNVLKENFTKRNLILKVVSIFIIAIGIALLTI